MHTNVSIVGVGKERCTLLLNSWSTVMTEKAALVTRTTLRTSGHAPADSRQGAPSIRNCVTRLDWDWPDGGWRYK